MKTKVNERVYLDFASQTMPSKRVINEMKKVSKENFNPSGIYLESVNSENILEESREKIAKVLGVRRHEIYFTSNATLSCASSIFGVVNYFKSLKKDVLPHVITSNIEHLAVLENIKFLEKNNQIEATYVKVDTDGFINVQDVLKEIKENTVLISIMYVNNEIGTIQEIKNISKGIKEWKRDNQRDPFDYPYFHTDASQAGNYLSLYINTLGVDLLSLNGSKIYGPKSTGLLMKREYVNLSPFYFGGSQERGIFSGTVDIEKIAGLSIAIEDCEKRHNDKKLLESIATKRNNLIDLINKNIPEARLIGYFNNNEWKEDKLGIKKEERIAKRLPSNISVWLPDFSSDEMVIRLDQKGFAVSAGSACSAKSDEYSHVIFNVVNDKKFFEDSANLLSSQSKINKKDFENFSKKLARETIRISINQDTKEEDLKRFAKVLKDVYFKFKRQ